VPVLEVLLVDCVLTLVTGNCSSSITLLLQAFTEEVEDVNVLTMPIRHPSGNIDSQTPRSPPVLQALNEEAEDAVAGLQAVTGEGSAALQRAHEHAANSIALCKQPQASTSAAAGGATAAPGASAAG
jgi:hypothetical protein